MLVQVLTLLILGAACERFGTGQGQPRLLSLQDGQQLWQPLWLCNRYKNTLVRQQRHKAAESLATLWILLCIWVCASEPLSLNGHLLVLSFLQFLLPVSSVVLMPNLTHSHSWNGNPKHFVMSGKNMAWREELVKMRQQEIMNASSKCC